MVIGRIVLIRNLKYSLFLQQIVAILVDLDIKKTNFSGITCKILSVINTGFQKQNATLQECLFSINKKLQAILQDKILTLKACRVKLLKH